MVKMIHDDWKIPKQLHIRMISCFRVHVKAFVKLQLAIFVLQSTDTAGYQQMGLGRCLGSRWAILEGYNWLSTVFSITVRK